MDIQRQTSETGKPHNPIELDLKADDHPSSGSNFSFSSSRVPGFYDSEQEKGYDYITTFSLEDVVKILLAIQQRLESIPRNEMDGYPFGSGPSYSSEKAEQELLDQFEQMKMSTLLLKTVNSYINAVNKTREFAGEIRSIEPMIWDDLLQDLENRSDAD